ncbi:DUF2812 domain-containing protein [Undibacterium sp. Di27W]|uniref:DUF2812 domain-containing protein n=1 Tax=Undibacterium sp. Di27W TaxID=3413036 RepID=UPI003BF41013
MSETLIKKFKCFWAWEDEQEQLWLQDMASQGWHFKKRNMLGIYSFIQGQPAQLAYRLDYVPVTKWNVPDVVEPDDSYQQLLIDAGWEHVFETSGWQYWRMPVKQGQIPEIYTDAASKQMKYKRLLLGLCFWDFLLFFVIGNPMDTLQNWGHGWLAYIAVFGIALPAALHAAYSTVRVYLRIRQLRT